MADDHHDLAAGPAALLETNLNQPRPDPLSLVGWQHSHGPEPERLEARVP